MFILIRLYLAHCLGDFPFQTNYIFKLKQKGYKGIVLHALIIVLCCLALSWPYLTNPTVLTFIAFIGISHFIQDSIKIKFTSPQNTFWLYILDQLFHAGIIALLFLTSLKDLRAPLDQENIFLRLYSNDHLMIYLIILILATYNGFFLIESFKISFLGGPGRQDKFEKKFGIFERALIVTVFLAKDHFLVLLPAAMLLRPLTFFLAKDAWKLHKDFLSFKEMALSCGLSLLLGGILFFLESGHPIY